MLFTAATYLALENFNQLPQALRRPRSFARIAGNATLDDSHELFMGAAIRPELLHEAGTTVGRAALYRAARFPG